MTRLLWSTLLFVVLVPVAEAQTLKHDFGDYDVYIRIEETWIETWRVSEDGECMMYPSTVDYNDDVIRFPKGTEWTVKRTGTTMDITFPGGRTVVYERTQLDPATLCDVKGKSG